MGEFHHLLRSHFPNVINRFIRRWIAHRLGGQPVLAVAAVKITTQHPKCQSIDAGHYMEEWFLLNRVALQCGDVSPRHPQFSTFVISHLTNSSSPLADFAAMSAGKTFNCVVIE